MAEPTLSPDPSSTESPGSMVAGTYSYRCTYVTKYGETTPGPVSGVATVVPPVGDSTGALFLENIPLETVDYVTSRRLYRTSVGNMPPYLFVAEIPSDVSTYLDTYDDADLGTEPPVANSAASNGKIYGNLFLQRPIISAVDTTVSSTGVDRASAITLPPAAYSFVSVPLANSGVVLPYTSDDRKGLSVTIKNMSAVNPLKIYPSAPLTAIGGGSPSEPYTLPGLDTVTLLLVSEFVWMPMVPSISGGVVLPAIPVASNYYAGAAGVPVGGLYCTRNNSANAPTSTFDVTASITGNVMTVFATPGTLLAGQVLTGVGLPSVPPMLYILNQLSGLPGDTGAYELSGSTVVGVSTITVNESLSVPDVVYIRTV